MCVFLRSEKRNTAIPFVCCGVWKQKTKGCRQKKKKNIFLILEFFQMLRFFRIQLQSYQERYS